MGLTLPAAFFVLGRDAPPSRARTPQAQPFADGASRSREAGVDAVHVSAGSFFPHPRNPAGADLPINDASGWIHKKRFV